MSLACLLGRFSVQIYALLRLPFDVLVAREENIQWPLACLAPDFGL
jgi:hypothetical protein